MDMGGHDHSGMSPPAGAGAASGGAMKQMRYTHMTFFWGKNSEVLFTMWPGTRGGMYALALIFVFALAVILEFLGSRRMDACLSALVRRAPPAVAGAVRTAVHAVRIGVAYLLMLALMSFNGGVFLVAVAGHAAGFLAFRAGLCGGPAQVEEDRKNDPACC